MLTTPGRWLTETHDKLRLWKDRGFRRFVDALPPWLTPNHVTWFRTAVMLAWFPFALFEPSLWQIAVYAFIYLLDLVDGAVARFRDRVTPWGSCLDHVSDKFANIAVLLAIYGATGYQFGFLVPFMVWDIVMAVVVALEVGTGSKTLAYLRSPLEFAVKTALWASLLFIVLPTL
ncbi:MAG: CDP-alcohol phosphatidyltransferase family protein [bacterium]|nr:CDP-alcohol phosphatidyltransferase family protein [bacterium]